MIKSCLLSKVIISQSCLKTQLSVSSVKQQTAALQNTSFCNHYMITYESCIIGKVSAYSCERTMKEYVHGLFTTDVENWTSNCRQLYFVESMRKHFVLTDGTGSYCKWRSSFTFYKLQCASFKICFWTLSWSRNAAVTTWLLLRSGRM